jgi:hypothetical protein
MLQYTPQKDLRQALSFSLSEKASHYSDMFSGFIDDQVIGHALSKFNPKQRSVMNHIFGASDRLGVLTFAYDTIARDCKVSYSTVYRTVHMMSILGLIHRVTRLTNTCIITVNPIIYKYADKLKYGFFYLKRIALRNLISSSMRNEEPLREIFISKPCKYMYQLLDKGKSVYLRGMNQLKSRLKERRLIMDEAGGLVISPTLRDMTEKLRLTKLGQLKLLAFDDDVLRVVWGSYRSTKNVHSPFDWMVVACEQYSMANKIRVDWDIYYSLLKRYNVTDNKKYIRPVESKPLFVGSSSSSSVPRWKQFPTDTVAKGFEKFDEMRSQNLSS